MKLAFFKNVARAWFAVVPINTQDLSPTGKGQLLTSYNKSMIIAFLSLLTVR
jgi:hypothetical protein